MHARFYLLLLMPWVAIANPSDPVVMAGSAHFDGANSSTLLIQTSDGSIIHWGSFSIGQGEMTRFILPSGESAVLNRVVGQMPSSIAGLLESNGRVYLINPRGILVDKTGVVNTNSFFASTLDVLDSEFLDGKQMLWKGESDAAIVNLGRIQSREGDLFLFSRQIENRGVLQAEKGVVGLGAGSDILLAMEGEKRILIRPNLGGQIIDSGVIDAVQAEIEADGSGFGLGIRHSGKIQAFGTEEREGRIYLVAEKGVVTSTGELRAKDEVYVLGDKIGLYEEAKIEVPGGKVFIGGDFQGKNKDIPNAAMTAVDRNVSIDVSGQNGADGGRVIIWADGACHFLGQIHAEGANGGFVEVSGKKFLNYDGMTHLKALGGKNGSLLLDPVNLTIGGGADTAVVLFPTAGSIQYWQQSLDAAAMAVSNLTVASIIAQLALGDLVVQAATDTLLASATTLGLGLGDLIVLDTTNIAAATENHLTLTADNHVYLHGQINYSPDAGTGNIGDVNLIAGGDVLLIPYSENPAPTQQSLINMAAGPTGQGNIFVQGKNIRVKNHLTATTAGITNGSTGTTTLHATQGSVTLEGGSVVDAVSAITTSGALNITTVEGSLDLIASPTAATGSTALVFANLDISVNADLGVSLLGGGALGNSATLTGNQGVLINSPQGDIRLIGGAGINAVATITAGTKDLIVNANQGNVSIAGGAGSGSFARLSSVLANVYIDVYGTQGILLTGGNGISSFVSIFAEAGLVSLNAWNGSLNLIASQNAGASNASADIRGLTSISFRTGFDCNLMGGVDLSTFSQMTAQTGINGIVGGNLTLQGGSGSGASATINNFTGDLSIAVENHLSLFAGIGTTSFAQIGGDADMTNSNIILSKIGGNCLLRGIQTPMGMNSISYAAIGHGDFAAAISSLQGDIVFTTGIGGNLILQGGNTVMTNNRNFAQIGHFSGTTNMGGITTGDIRINEVGNSITLNPGTDYALIGHGNNTLNTASNIAGHIIVYSSTANCTFEAPLLGGVTDVFTQIGHIGAQSTFGDILVDIAGPLKMRSASTTDSLSLIGHGNTTSPVMVAFTGDIEVYAQSIELIAGNATGAQSQIGMFAPLTSTVNIPNLMTPGLPIRTSLIVEAREDIYLQAGSTGMMLGNALIGFGPVDNVVSVTIDNLTVRSLNGDITLTGGAGTFSPITGAAFIGLASNLMATPTLFQSDLTVECPQGTLTLNGIPPVTSSMGISGSATISNGGASSETPSPYNVFVNAGEIILNSGGSAISGNIGNAQILSTRNMTVQTAHDLQLISPNGQVGISASGFNSDMTFRIGNDVIMEGGNGFGSRISPNLNLSASQAVTMTFDIGHDLILRPNIAGISNAFIGPDSLTGMNFIDQTLSMNLKIGHDLIVLGGTASTGLMTTGIAIFPMSQLNQIFTLRLDIGDNAQISAGTTTNNDVRIGPTAMSANNQMVDIGMKVGNDLLLNAGNVSMTAANNAFIASPTMTSSQQSLLLNLDVGGNLALHANASSGSVCQIGPSSMTSSLQVFSMSAQVGSNLQLIGSQGTNDVLIGPTAVAGANQNVSMDFVIGANLELQSGAGSAVIGTSLTGAGVTAGTSQFSIHFDVGGNTSLLGLGNAALIGPLLDSGMNNIYSITLQGKGDLILRGGSGMDAFAGIGTSPTGGGFSGMGGTFSIDCTVDKDLIVAAGSTSGANAFIGPSDVANSRNTSTTRVSATGNGAILGSNMGGTTYAIIGPRTFSASDSMATVEVDVGNDLLLRLGNTSGSFALIGAPDMTGTRDTLTVNVDVGQTLTLDGAGGSNSFCQIGPLSNTQPDQRMFLNISAGKDLILLGNTSSSTTTAIGLNDFEGGTNQTARISVDVGGNFHLTGTNGLTSFTYVGCNLYSGTSSNLLTIDLNVGDSAFLQGGSGSRAYIGSTSFSSVNSVATLALTIGNDLIMGSDGADCFIGSDSLMAPNLTLDISLNVGRNCLMKGSTGSGVNVNIGPRSIMGASNISLLQMDVGGNLTLEGSTNNMNMNNAVFIGPFTEIGGSTNMTNTMDLNVGGDCLLVAGDSINNSVYIAPTLMQSDNHFLSLNMDVGGSLTLDGGSTMTGFCQIGPQSGTGQLQNYNLNFIIGKDLNLYASSATNSITLIGASTFNSTGGRGSLAFDIGGNLLLQADTVGGSPSQIGVTNTSSETSILFNRIGGNASIRSGVNYSLIGHGPSATTTPSGDIFFKEVVGNFTVVGGGGFAQVGHVGNSGGASTLTGDITIEQIGGALTLQGGGALNGTATIGHGNLFGNGDDVLIGSISVRTGSAELLAAGSSAIIGFDAPTGGTITIASPLVELISERNVTLTAGLNSKAVVGYYNPTATTDATIGIINVSASGGNITLTGATPGTNGGGFAVIGTQSMMGTSRSTIKITAGRDLHLLSGGLGGGALIVNNQIGVFQPGYTINIDPISIILLSDALGTANIVSGGNLILNFDDRLDINFDSLNGVLQDGSANILAGSDIFINTSIPSYGSINIGGSTVIGNTSSIQSGAGSIFIGTETNPGAGDINVGFVAATLGPTTIQSLVETQIHAAGNINVQGGGASAITSNGNVTLDSGNNILLNSAGGAQLTSAAGSLFLTAAGSITGVSGIFSAAGSIISDAGLDLAVTGGSMTTNTGDVIATVGRDISITGTVSSLGGNYIGVAGRDINQAGPANITGVGLIDWNAGRSVNSTSTVANNTGSISMTAGEDVNLTGGTVTSTAGRIQLNADRNVTNSIATTISGGSGMLTVVAGQNVNQTAGTLSNVSGILSLTAGEDINLLGGSVTSSSGSIQLNAVRNVVNSITTSIPSGGGGLFVTAGEYINQGGTFSNISGTLSLAAGIDYNLTGTTTSSSGDIQIRVDRDINLSGAGIISTNGTEPIDARAKNNVNLSNTSSIRQFNIGEILVVADRNMNLNGSSLIFTSTGFLVLVVDNLFPEPPHFGRGSLFINAAGGAQVNASGGELRIYTSRQSFNTMTGALLNGVAFAPGAVYVDTATEMWDSYWARALGGTPYTVFYKDAATTVPPIPPVPPTPPAPVIIVTPTGVITVPFSVFNEFFAAIAEPFRDWATFDEFIFDVDEFDQEITCPKFTSGSLALSEREITSGTSASSCSSGKQTLTMLRQKYRNYHTKKLDIP